MAEGNVVSEAYDPEFGTSGNAQEIKDAIAKVSMYHFDEHLGELKNILEVVRGDNKNYRELTLSEREMRIIRFCLIRAYESI